MVCKFVQGSTTKDMFHMRNATGLRNCTLQGLTVNIRISKQLWYKTTQQQVHLFIRSVDLVPNDYRTWIATTVAGTGQFTPNRWYI